MTTQLTLTFPRSELPAPADLTVLQRLGLYMLGEGPNPLDPTPPAPPKPAPDLMALARDVAARHRRGMAVAMGRGGE